MYEQLVEIAVRQFGDIVTDWRFFYRRSSLPLKLRLFIGDETYLDVWVSPSQGRYSYHWEQRAVRGLIHRHDNAPDHPEISTFPRHFHDGSEENVQPSMISDHPKEALQEFLTFVQEKLKEFEDEA